jgi:outer membrane protein, heavy metal efflux system
MRFVNILMAAALVPAAYAGELGPMPADAPPATPMPASAAAPLTLEEAVRLALDKQPQIDARTAQIAEARENAVASGELPDPRLRFGLANAPVDTFDLTQEPMTQGIIGVTQIIPGGDKRRLAADRMLRQAEQGEAALEATKRRIAREVGLAWINIWYPGQALQLVRRIEREYERQIDWAQAALAANKLSQEETLALRVMQEYVQDRKAELSRSEARARAMLSRWVGEAAKRPLSDEALPANAPLPADRQEAALNAHPELAALRRAVEAARSEADLAREAYKPDWNVDLSYGVRGGDRPDFLSALVSVDLPLFTEKRQDRRLAGKVAAVERAQSELEDRRLALAADLAAALADWEAADRRVAHFESTLIPLTESRVESALAAYRSGKSSFVQVLEARRAELEARLQLLNQQVARGRAGIEIRYFAD